MIPSPRQIHTYTNLIHFGLIYLLPFKFLCILWRLKILLYSLYVTVFYLRIIVTYVFQSEFTLYSCLNVKELLAQNRRDIWSLNDSNGIWSQNHLVRKWILNNLANLAKWLYIYDIHHWKIFRSSYRKLAWVGFEPKTTEFRSDALTDWAIRPWVQLALRVNFA